MKHPVRLLLGACVAALPLFAHATAVHVEVTGVVDYNVIKGDMRGVPSGAPVSMGFDVDSNDFVDSPSYPTRGYRIDLGSFAMTVGGVNVPIDNPQPDADAFFVLRNDDPAVDGFFISSGNVDYNFPVSVHIPGLAPAHELDFSRTFTGTTTLSSLNILDAVGHYGFENMSSYLWTIGRFGNPGAEYVPESITISAVPEPATLALMGLGALVVLRRTARRR
jgi:hypothetical protein